MARTNRSKCLILTMGGTFVVLALCIMLGPGLDPKLPRFPGFSESTSSLRLSSGKFSGDPVQSNKEQSSSQHQDDRKEARAMQEIETSETVLRSNGEIKELSTNSLQELGNTQLSLADQDQFKEARIEEVALVKQEAPEVEETTQSDMEASPVNPQDSQRSGSVETAATGPSFYTYPTVGNVDLLCKNLTNCDDCQRVRPLLTHMLSSSTLGLNGTELFLIPMDPLAIFRKKPYMYHQMLTRVLNEVTHHRNYLRFGGSDHVFVCLSEGCEDVFQDITQRHPVGRDGRAMWFGQRSQLQGIRRKWPCPNRVFSVPDELLNGLRWEGRQGCREMDGETMIRAFNGLLREAAKQIEGMNRWECSKKFWTVDLSMFKGKKHQGCMAIERHKICISGIPKCASSTMNILVRRMLGKPAWNDTKGQTHGAGNGIKWVNSRRDFDQYKRIMQGTDWLNIAVVREPAARFLSAFVDKIVHRREYGRVGFPKSSVTEPTLEWVINRFLSVKQKGKMGYVDLHFRPMHFFASMGVVRYDFIARVSTLADDMEAILRSLGLWEEYGASGWGEEGTLSFKEAKGRNVQKNGVQYYTEDTLRRVHHLYKMDYDLLGFSMAEEWGVEPS